MTTCTEEGGEGREERGGRRGEGGEGREERGGRRGEGGEGREGCTTHVYTNIHICNCLLCTLRFVHLLIHAHGTELLSTCVSIYTNLSA